jgi:putative sugar O-methyltransferase
MTQKYRGSDLWETYHRTRITKEASAELDDFKSGDVNFKLGLWNPRTNGVRYLKELIYNLCDRLDEAGWQRLGRISGREVGSPIAVRRNGEMVCLDYLQAVLELEFMDRHLTLDGATVLEIGAGYGRTAHTLLSNHEIAAYYVVDLENSLDLARAYLGRVLWPEDFARIRFLPAEELDGELRSTSFDVCLNIDSFAEMDPEIVRNYLALVAENAQALYVKNPVGKYLDPGLDDHADGEEVVAMALRTGLLRDVIDIHDSEAVRRQADRFVAAYRPAPGWTCAGAEWAPPWSYYWQSVYRAGDTDAGAAAHV